MWDRIRIAIDNPILVKHMRSRLRMQPFFSALAVVVILCLCIAYAGYELDLYQTGSAAGMIVAIQFVLLVIMGAGQVGASVGGARTSGILDFHRVSPLTPTELTLGFFFGAPIREYALFAATLPFTVLCMAFGIPSLRGFVQLLLVLLTSAWMIHGFVLFNALITRGKTPTGGLLALIIFAWLFGYPLVMGGQFSVNMVENDHRMTFFGMSLPWVPVVMLYQLPVLFFILLAARRKMESQRLHPLSKPQAIVAMMTFATLIVGAVWQKDSYEIYRIAALYLLLVSGLLLSMMVTPTQAEYAKGLLRASKHGKTHLSWWDDLSVNWLSTALLAGIALAAGTLAGTLAAGPVSPWASAGRALGLGHYPLALAAAVLTIAYFGLALQYFQLRFAKRGQMYFALFLFVFWILPLLAGWIQAVSFGASGTEAGNYAIFALSPMAGIGMIAAIADESVATAVQASTLTPILLFTFYFNYRLVGARRRVMRSVLPAIERAKPVESEPEVAEPVAGSLEG